MARILVVHGGHYQKPVEQWLRTHVWQFGSKPTAFVSVCLGVLQRDPKVDADLNAIIHRFVDPIDWHPTLIKIVAGALSFGARVTRATLARVS